MPGFVDGVGRFQRDVYPEHQALFEKLDHGQSPEVLFIGCADSRVDPSMITNTLPGELFVCRNAGNIVPPYTETSDGMAASIEYAMTILKVPHIVVCGHSQCGAMNGALAPEGLTSLPRVQDWLGHCEEAVELAREFTSADTSRSKLDTLIEQNVLLQLRHLQTHPSVNAAVAAGNVELHGWVYEIKTGIVKAYDENRKTFLPIGDKEADTNNPRA